MISQQGHIRVGIDVNNTGVVSFLYENGQPLNLKGSWKNRYGDAVGLNSTVWSGDIAHLYLPQRSKTWTASKEELEPFMNAINPYGNELTVAYFREDEDSGIEFKKTVDSYPTNKYDVSPSTEYTFWGWLSMDVVYEYGDGADLYWEIREYNSGGSFIGVADTIPVDVDIAHRVIALESTFTTDASTASLGIALIRDNVTSVPEWEIYIHGISLWAGEVIEEPVWNVGNANSFLDDITPYVKAVTGSIGKNNWEQLLFDEGTVEIQLNNQDKIFSLENPIHSPYFARLQPHQRIWVLMAGYDNHYHLLWSGWTHQFNLETGTANGKNATITGRHGKYSIESQDPELLIARDDEYSSDLLVELLDGGYEIATGSDRPGGSREHVQEDYSQGVLVPLFGAGFVDQPTAGSYMQGLENIAELNGNYLFLTRYGRIFFHTFEEVRDDVADELPVNYMTEFDYIYAPKDLYKNIVVQYDKYFFDDDIEMQGEDTVISSGSTNQRFDIQPQFNNRPLIGDVVLDISAFQPVDYSATPAFGSVNATPTLDTRGIYTFYKVEASNTTDLDYRITWVSRDSGDVWYAQETDLEYTLAGDVTRGLETLTYKNPLVTSEFMAQNLAELQKARRTNVLSWFDRGVLTNRSAAILDYALNHTLGDTVWILDPQVGGIPKHLAIIGERWEWDGAFFRMEYRFAPTTGEVDLVCVAEFDWETTEVDDGTVVFENLSESGTEIIGYLWDFGDGNTSGEISPTHVYAESGIYEVELTLYAINGCMDSVSYNVTSTVDPCASLCLDIDFTASKGCFEATRGVWDSGNGWESTFKGGVTTLSQAILYKELDAPITIGEIDTISTMSASDTRVHVVQVRNGGAGGASGTLVYFNSSGLGSITGSGEVTWTHTPSSPVTGDFISVAVQFNADTPNTGFITGLVVYDDEMNPIC